MISLFRLLCQITSFIVFFLILSGVIEHYKIYTAIHGLHLFPSLSLLAWLIWPLAIYITLTVLLLTLIAGRLYCSWICPVGFIQDLIFKFRSKSKAKFIIQIKKNLRPTLRKRNQYFFISNFILGLCLFLIFFSNSWYGLFDHYSNFIRLINLNFSEISWDLHLLVAIIFFITITLVPIFYPRFFCLHICPSGAIFRLLAPYSRLKIISHHTCTACQRCEPQCPTQCIQDGKINVDACIACFECLEACSKNGFKLKWFYPFQREKKIKSENVLSDRRHFLKTFTFFIPSLGFAWAINKRTPLPAVLKTPIPPGGKSATMFFRRCVGCGLCISVCPTRVLRPDRKENTATRLKPYMDFVNSYCSYECNACLAVCPTSAISYFPLQQKKTIQIGYSVLNEKTCIPYTEHIVCGSCAEHCPTGAISMIEKNNVFYPVVKKEFCVGCGICHRVCPTSPRSIDVIPLTVHSTAYDPVKVNTKLDHVESYEFPF